MVRRVLLVEFDSTADSELSQLLRHQGFTVHSVPDPALTLEFASKTQPDLFLIAGPSLPVAELALELKRRSETTTLPVIQVAPSEPASLLRVVPEASLEPPVSPFALLAAIDDVQTVLASRTQEELLADLHLESGSGLDSLEALCAYLPEWLLGCGLMRYQVRQVTLAVRELVANAIEWGHGYDPSRPVSIRCQLDADKVSILVSDTGPGFDPGNVPHAARPGDSYSHLRVREQRNLREGGFGILLAGGLVDQLCFSATGNEGLLLKYLPATSAAAHGRPGAFSAPAAS